MNASAAGGLADSPWPMFRGNLNHTGLSPYDTSSNNGQLKWSFETGGAILSSPSIASDGTIYIGSDDNKLYAINKDGTEKWNFTTNGLIRSSPAIGSDGTIYIGEYDLKFYAINPDGSEKWNLTNIGWGFRESSPAIGSDGTIYVGSWDWDLYAINPNGTVKWRFDTGDRVRSSPAIGSDGTIYVGSDDEKLYAINPNGTKKWSYKTPYPIASSPAIGSDGTIYVGSNMGYLYAINPNGTKKWIFTDARQVRSSPAIGSDGTIYVGSDGGKVYGINPDGTEKWNFTAGDFIFSSPAIGSEGTIYVGSRDGKQYAIYPNGSQKWNFSTGASIRSSPAIGSNGTIYVGSNDYKLYAIGTQNLEVNVTSHFTTLNSAAQSLITVSVFNGTDPIQGATVNLTSDNGGFFSSQSGTTDVNGNFTSIFNAPTVTTQKICRMTAEANKTGYGSDSGYVDITIKPIPWPMFRHNLNHSGVSPYDTSWNPGKLKWTFSTGDIILSSPAIGSNGTIYIGSRDNKLYAINPDGAERWNFRTGGFIDSSPAIGSDETIYVGSNDGKLYAINPDGSEKWNFTTNNYIESSPSIGYDGTIYFGSKDKKLYAVNPDGTEKWNFTTGGGIRFSSAGIGSDGIIYVGSIDNKLYAIYLNGTEKWNFETGNVVYSSPAIGFDGTIYVGSVDRKLYAINHDGSEKWNYSTGSGSVFSSPAIGLDGTIYVGSDNNKLYAINPDGTEKWSYTAGDHIFYSSPAIGSEGTIYIGSSDFRLYAINPDGTEKWSYLTNWPIEASPAIGSDGTIYVGSTDSKLYAIGNASAPPTLYMNVSQDKEDVTLYWDLPSTPDIDHYMIHRSTSQTDFDFNTVWVNTSSDNETGEPGPIPLRTMWNDTKAALPGDPNYQKEYYYIIRAVNIYGRISTTSRTVGKWTKTFQQGVSTFSLPLEPIETMNTTTDYFLKDMNSKYIKWMDPANHIWMKHGNGGVNDTQIEVGKGYEVAFDSITNYTFTGMPASMIKYDDSTGFLGFDSNSDAKNLSAVVDSQTGNVTLTWDQPSIIGINDQYHILRSAERDGFWNGNYLKIATLPFDILSYTDFGNATAGTQYYYMIVPVNETNVKGTSTYSVGVWTEEYLSQYDTFGIPLKLESYQTADWFCDNIPDTVGINYFNNSQERWSWHSTRMSEGAFDPLMEMVYGYQISTSSATKFSFIGI
jgi:outer membrane protein assembly factor BamB